MITVKIKLLIIILFLMLPLFFNILFSSNTSPFLKVRSMSVLCCIIKSKSSVLWLFFSGQWSCWSEWSPCSLPCSSGGYQKRSRICLASHRPLLEASDCKGASSEQRSCEDRQCQGGVGTFNPLWTKLFFRYIT